MMPRLLSQVVLIAITSLTLLSTGELLAQSKPPTATVQWRRTVNGWERADLWEVGNVSDHTVADGEFTATAPLPPPGIHPILVAGFLFAAAGLMAVGADKSR